MRLNCVVDYVTVDEPGIQSVSLDTTSGAITVKDIDSPTSVLQRPGSPSANISLPRRGLSTLLSEDLKRLDPDDVYGRVLASFVEQDFMRTSSNI